MVAAVDHQSNRQPLDKLHAESLRAGTQSKIFAPMNIFEELSFDCIRDSEFATTERIDWSPDGLSVVITYMDQSVKFSFSRVIAYRVTKESYSLESMAWRDRSSAIGQCIYRVEDSEFVAWARAEDPTLPDDIQHYEIFTDSDFVVVLSLSPPVAEDVDYDELAIRAPLSFRFPDGETVSVVEGPLASEQFDAERPTDVYRPLREASWNAAPLRIISTGAGGWARFADIDLGGARFSLRTEGVYFRHRPEPVGPALAGKLRRPGPSYALWQVENSSLVEWVRAQSYGILGDHRLAHFVCIAENGVIDIVSQMVPALLPATAT